MFWCWCLLRTRHLHWEMSCSCLKAWRRTQDCHRNYKSRPAGFASPAVFRRIVEYLDLLLFDIKHWDETKHKEKNFVSNTPILQNMKYAIDIGKEVLPRLPVIPNYNNSLADASGFVRRLKQVGAKRVKLLPFHQFGENKYNMLGREYEFSHTKLAV